MKNQKGQGLIEVLVILPLFLALISGLGYLAYYALNYQVASYHLHEALMCSQHETLVRCEQEHQTALKDLFLFNEQTKLKIHRRAGTLHGVLFLGLKPPVTIKLEVPMRF